MMHRTISNPLIITSFLLMFSCSDREERVFVEQKPSETRMVTQHPEMPAKQKPDAERTISIAPFESQRKKAIHLPATQIPVQSLEYEEEIAAPELPASVPVTLEAIFKELDKPVQAFEVNSKEGSMITGKEGTVVHIPAGAFDTKESKVRIELKEYYTMEDFFFGNLNTHTNGGFLESGGMIYLQAYAGEKKLELKDGKELLLEMPAKGSFKDGMEIYYQGHDIAGNNTWVRGRSQTRTWGKIYKVVDYSSVAIGRKDLELFRDYDVENCDCVLRGKKMDTIITQARFDKRGRLLDINVVKAPGYPQRYKRNLTFSKRKYYFSFGYYSDGWRRMTKEVDKLRKNRENYINVKAGRYKVSYTLHPDLVNKILEASREAGELEITLTQVAHFSKSNLADLVRTCRMAKGKNIDAGSSQAYFLTANKLGYINCDRFYNVPEKNKTQLVVKAENNALVNIYFHNIASVMNGTTRRNSNVFAGVPKNSKVTIIALKTENGKTYLAMKTINISGLPVKDLEYEEVTVEDIKRKVKFRT